MRTLVGGCRVAYHVDTLDPSCAEMLVTQFRLAAVRLLRLRLLAGLPAVGQPSTLGAGILLAAFPQHISLHASRLLRSRYHGRSCRCLRCDACRLWRCSTRLRASRCSGRLRSRLLACRCERRGCLAACCVLRFHSTAATARASQDRACCGMRCWLRCCRLGSWPMLALSAVN